MTVSAPSVDQAGGHVGGIPVRNLWLLMLYASEFFRHEGQEKRGVEDNPDDIPDLVAEILARMVELRLMRNLTFGYRTQTAELSRVRGRIDLLNTERRMLLARGKVACRFENLTVDTTRNRFVRAAIDSIARVVRRPELGHRCRTLSTSLRRLGVSGERPTRAEASADRYGRHDAEDRFMVAAAQLACDLALPTESQGNRPLVTPGRDVVWIRRLYERAVGGFYDVVLSPQGWRVNRGSYLNWQVGRKTAGIDRILPAMQTDIVLDHRETGQRIVIDTKFTSIVTRGRFREESLRSGYLYQIYAYLRSQEGNGDLLSEHAAGLLLHPSVGEMVDEMVVIQGHAIRFATVDLGASAGDIREQLLQLIQFPDTFSS